MSTKGANYKWKDFAKDLMRLSGDLYSDARKVFTKEYDLSRFYSKYFGWIRSSFTPILPNST